MVKVVYVDWRDRQFPPEILGVCTKDEMAEKLRNDKVKELISEGYEMEEEVNVIIEEFELNDNDPINHPKPSKKPCYYENIQAYKDYLGGAHQYGKH